MLFDLESDLGQLHELRLGQARDLTARLLDVAKEHADAARIRHVLVRLRGDSAAGERRTDLAQPVFVGRHLTRDHGLAEAPAGVDGNE